MKAMKDKEFTNDNGMQSGKHNDSTNQHVTEMKCPECDGFISVSVQQLLVDSGITCPHCGLFMSISRPQSKTKTDALEKVRVAMEKLKEREKELRR